MIPLPGRSSIYRALSLHGSPVVKLSDGLPRRLSLPAMGRESGRGARSGLRSKRTQGYHWAFTCTTRADDFRSHCPHSTARCRRSRAVRWTPRRRVARDKEECCREKNAECSALSGNRIKRKSRRAPITLDRPSMITTPTSRIVPRRSDRLIEATCHRSTDEWYGQSPSMRPPRRRHEKAGALAPP